jgi:hypothetical protein
MFVALTGLLLVYVYRCVWPGRHIRIQYRKCFFPDPAEEFPIELPSPTAFQSLALFFWQIFHITDQQRL